MGGKTGRYGKVTTMVVLAMLAVASPTLAAPATFSAPTNYKAGTGPTSVAASDLDGDGKQDLVTANFNSNTVSVLLNTTPSSDLSISKNAPTTATTGKPFDYALTVTNKGPDAAPNVLVEDDLPAGVTYNDAASSGSCEEATSTTDPNDVRCKLASLPAGAGQNTATFVINVTPTQAGTLSNEATVASDARDLNTANNTSDTTTLVARAKPGAFRFDPAIYAVNEDAATATITVVRDGGSDGEVAVDYASSGGTATTGSDYTPTSGTLVFADGEATKTFDVPILVDGTNEGAETVDFALSNPRGGASVGAQSTAELTITDDDALPGISVGDVAVDEGDSGKIDAIFVVSLDRASGRDVSVSYVTRDATARAGEDYEGTAATLTIPAGQTRGEITVKVNGDATDEPNETFTVGLSNASNATILDGNGEGAITDDDEAAPPPPAANARPDAKNDSYRAREDRKLVVRPSRGVLRNDRDPYSEGLRARIVKGPRHGRLTLRSNGSFSYAPDRNYAGRDSFTYSVSDGRGGVDRATVRLSVRGVPEPRPPGGGGGGSGNSISIK